MRNQKMKLIEVDDIHVSIRNVCTVMNTKIRQQAEFYADAMY